MTTVYQKDYDYPVEANKYRLVISQTCPFAQRTDITRSLLGLEEVISLGVTGPIKTDKIWDFSQDPEGQDPVLEVEYVSELYKNTNPDYDGPYSVPVLVDVASKQVVNQESLDIIKDFATRFEPLHQPGAPDLYPEDQRAEIDEWFSRIGSEVMASPYGVLRAEDQESYDQHSDTFFGILEEIDERLASQEYLMGSSLTLADVVLYTPLVRFEPLFYPSFGLNKHRLQDYPNLWAYLQKLYQIPAFKDSTHIEAIRQGSYLGKNGRDYFGREVLPAGPQLKEWDA
ncbi:glutathione S-transferase C-terminal domain-containing protein [Hutsoniella sourekii]|uniref:glutathione S-transferase C-terminal domain-containing protein n=1 Tax=Hutsoniella sourekii TaxID=87650 RepID=UPI0004AE15DB|nr:glutathione S-transferase C-terminal domain-containing protein [Hutsoniella sourekii]